MIRKRLNLIVQNQPG